MQPATLAQVQQFAAKVDAGEYGQAYRDVIIEGRNLYQALPQGESEMRTILERVLRETTLALWDLCQKNPNVMANHKYLIDPRWVPDVNKKKPKKR